MFADEISQPEEEKLEARRALRPNHLILKHIDKNMHVFISSVTSVLVSGFVHHVLFKIHV